MNSAAKTLDVAETILAQLGGGRFIMMTGAKNILGDASSLQLRFQGSQKANSLRVVLESDDTYTVEFFKIRGISCREVSSLSMVQASSLRTVFESATGLRTSL